MLAADPATGFLRAVRRLTADDALWPAELPTGVADVVPDTLILESLCQAAASLNALEAVAASGDAAGHRGYLVSISSFRFAAPELRARVGETLILEVQRGEKLGSVVAFSGRALSTALPFDALPSALPGALSWSEQAAGSSREVASGRLLFAVSFA